VKNLEPRRTRREEDDVRLCTTEDTEDTEEKQGAFLSHGITKAVRVLAYAKHEFTLCPPRAPWFKVY
jgi:hypothetical protein